MNPPKTTIVPSYAEILREILSSIDGPISTEELAVQILQKRPSKAKNPYQAALEKIREENGRQLVYLDVAHVLPLRLVYNGVRYRIRLTKEIIEQAMLPIDYCFDHYLPALFNNEKITLIDSQGAPISAKILNASYTTTDFFTDKPVKRQRLAIAVKSWFKSQKFYAKDHILVTIEDWEKGVFRLERGQYGKQSADLIAEVNQSMADAFYELLESAHSEDIFVRIALPTVLARMAEKINYPPDHWMLIIVKDPRMTTQGWSICYPDSNSSMLDEIIADKAGQRLDVVQNKKSSKAERVQVFRLRVHLKHKTSIWREVEIQGEQTLEDLDNILRAAFLHDTSDHLSGFWKRAARSGGSRTRYREVDLGTINPFEYTEGADTEIAGLKLQVGDKLKYVYDFGDWIEHIIEVKSIGAAETNVQYPREIARNKAKYEYCTECLKKGKQVVANWICYNCSDEEQEDVILCEKCLENHEDHYVEELLY